MERSVDATGVEEVRCKVVAGLDAPAWICATPVFLLPEAPTPVPLEPLLLEPEAVPVATAGRDVKVGFVSIVTRTVDATNVSVVTYVLFAVAGQLVIVDGHAVTVAVRVVNTVEVTTSPEEPFGFEPTPAVDVASEAATGHTVVETRMVSVVTYVVFCLAGQSTTLEGHAVIVEVRVLKTVEVVNSPPLGWVIVAVGWGAVVSVIGQTVVETAIVWVVTKVVLSDAGQSVTVDGQAVMVAVLVVKTVEVVNAGGVTVEDGDDPPGTEEGIEELGESTVVEDCIGSDEEVADGIADEGVADGEADEGGVEIGLLDTGGVLIGDHVDDGTSEDEGADDGITDEGTTEDGIADEGITDEGATDDGITEEGITDDGGADGLAEGDNDGTDTGI